MVTQTCRASEPVSQHKRSVATGAIRAQFFCSLSCVSPHLCPPRPVSGCSCLVRGMGGGCPPCPSQRVALATPGIFPSLLVLSSPSLFEDLAPTRRPRHQSEPESTSSSQAAPCTPNERRTSAARLMYAAVPLSIAVLEEENSNEWRTAADENAFVECSLQA